MLFVLPQRAKQYHTCTGSYLDAEWQNDENGIAHPARAIGWDWSMACQKWGSQGMRRGMINVSLVVGTCTELGLN